MYDQLDMINDVGVSLESIGKWCPPIVAIIESENEVLKPPRNPSSDKHRSICFDYQRHVLMIETVQTVDVALLLELLKKCIQNDQQIPPN